MAFIIDNRNGLGKSVTVELQTEPEKSIGTDAQGRPRVVYFSNVPQIIVKTTYSVVGSIGDWTSLIEDMEASYEAIDTVPMGIFIESVSTSGGWYIIENESYYAGTYVETDYSNLSIAATPPTEFKITENISGSFAPAGYLPDGKSYYTATISAATISRSSTITFESSKSIDIGSSWDGGFVVTSKSLSNFRIINNIEYVDMSIQLSELIASY